MRELTIQTYLAERESELAEFEYRLILARKENRIATSSERFNMTPQEELYAEFFRNEKTQVSGLDDAELRERRESWEKVAFEARARLYAAKDEEKERAVKKRKGFNANVKTDELTTNAINAVTERSVRMSKREKMITGLMEKVGVDRATAEAMVPDVQQMSKGRSESSKETLAKENKKIAFTPLFTEPEPSKPVNNPFAKKPETTTETTVDVQIMDDNTVIIEKTVETKPVEPVKQTFKNPFAKG